MKLYHAKFAVPLPGGASQIQEEDFYLPDASAVRRTLRQRGVFPIKIYEQKPAAVTLFDNKTTAWQLQLLRALRFQTATASVGTALLNIIEGETDPERRLAFLPCRTVLKGGGTFAEALRELKLMDAATMAIITAGERAGDLKGVVQHAIQHIEEKGKNMKIIWAALGWLSFDMMSVFSSLWGAQFGFIPYLKEQGVKNATPEKVEQFNRAIEQASWINGSLIVIITGALLYAVILAYSFFTNKHKERHWSKDLVMRLPLFGEYLFHNSLHDTTKLIARLLYGKVPLTEAIDIIIDTTIEPSTRLYWTNCRKRILAGVDPAKALGQWPLSKPEINQIATVQSVDQLTEVYNSISEERGQMTKTAQRKITMAGMILLMTLTGAVVLTMIYLLMIQNQGFMDSLSSLKDGA